MNDPESSVSGMDVKTMLLTVYGFFVSIERGQWHMVGAAFSTNTQLFPPKQHVPQNILSERGDNFLGEGVGQILPLHLHVHLHLHSHLYLHLHTHLQVQLFNIYIYIYIYFSSVIDIYMISSTFSATLTVEFIFAFSIAIKFTFTFT